MTDQSDQMIVFAILSTKHNLKGLVINGYGIYSNSAALKIVERFK